MLESSSSVGRRATSRAVYGNHRNHVVSGRLGVGDVLDFSATNTSVVASLALQLAGFNCGSFRAWVYWREFFATVTTSGGSFLAIVGCHGYVQHDLGRVCDDSTDAFGGSCFWKPKKKRRTAALRGPSFIWKNPSHDLLGGDVVSLVVRRARYVALLCLRPPRCRAQFHHVRFRGTLDEEGEQGVH